MTYIIGWKHENTAYLCSESAVTKREPKEELADSTSSFGECHVSRNDLQVFEGALKVVHLGNAIVGLCGRVDAIVAFLDVFSSMLLRRPDLKDAVEMALSQISSYIEMRNLQLLIAAPAAPGPKLFTFRFVTSFCG